MPGDSTSSSTSSTNDTSSLVDVAARGTPDRDAEAPSEAALLRAVGDYQDAREAEEPDFRTEDRRRAKPAREEETDRRASRRDRDGSDDDDGDDDFDDDTDEIESDDEDADDDEDGGEDEEDEEGEEDTDDGEDDEIESRRLRKFAERFGLKPREAKSAASALADDVAATLRGFGQQQQHQQFQTPPPGRQAAGSGSAAPQGDGSAPGLIDAKMLEDIEEWNPQAAAAIKALGSQVEQLHSAFRSEQAARLQTEINRTIDRFSRTMGLEKVYGQGRSTTAKQREAKTMVVQTAAAFQSVKRSLGVVISDEEAIEAAIIAANRGRILGASKKQARKEIRESLQRRQRRLDVVPSAGSVSRARGAGRGDADERTALQLAGQWQRQNRRRTA